MQPQLCAQNQRTQRTQTATYQRRRPETSALYQLIQKHLQSFTDHLAEHSGATLPKYVREEFEGILLCGQLSEGFARVVCRSCQFEHLVGFSCKSRTLCASCVARRMADTVFHLTHHVLPENVPYRQWTISFPFALRRRLARDKQLFTRCVRLFFRTVFAWQRRQARRLGIAHPIPGGIAVLQFWGSLLQLTPHAHNWIPDGIFYYQQDGTLAFKPLEPPDDCTLQALADKLYARVAKACAQGDPDDDCAPADEDQALLADFQAEATQGPKRSAAHPFLLDEPGAASSGGLSLHIGLPTPAGDTKALAHRLGYAMRPPIATKRLTETPAGKFRLKLRKPLSDGRTVLFFEPFTLLRNLAAIIAPPGFNLTRYFGILTPTSQLNNFVGRIE